MLSNTLPDCHSLFSFTINNKAMPTGIDTTPNPSTPAPSAIAVPDGGDAIPPPTPAPVERAIQAPGLSSNPLPLLKNPTLGPPPLSVLDTPLPLEAITVSDGGDATTSARMLTNPENSSSIECRHQVKVRREMMTLREMNLPSTLLRK